MEPEDSLPHSQVSATCPYPEPARSNPYPHIPLPEDSSQYYPTFYAWVSQVFSFPQFSPPKPCIRLYSSHTRYMPRPAHSSRYYHPNNIVWAVQIPFHYVIKLLGTAAAGNAGGGDGQPCNEVAWKEFDWSYELMQNFSHLLVQRTDIACHHEFVQRKQGTDFLFEEA